MNRTVANPAAASPSRRAASAWSRHARVLIALAGLLLMLAGLSPARPAATPSRQPGETTVGLRGDASKVLRPGAAVVVREVQARPSPARIVAHGAARDFASVAAIEADASRKDVPRRAFPGAPGFSLPILRSRHPRDPPRRRTARSA
jgi:hypothetical protein